MIEEMLVADLDAPRKQQHTATRIFNRPVNEHQGQRGFDSVGGAEQAGTSRRCARRCCRWLTIFSTRARPRSLISSR